MEMWLPIAGWNGSFRGTSPNGLGGVLNYNAMGVGVTDGFAIASTDTGHQGGDTAWMRDPEKLTDFAGRAMHETTVVGKALATMYYGTAPKSSYMLECGGGSAAALHEVQKYPADYNGVVVGGHAAHLTRQIFGQLWLWMAAHPNGAAVLPASKLTAIHDAVLNKCDMLDGVKDGLLEDPMKCTFDPKEIACKAGDEANCLTAAQVEAVQKIYAGPTNPRTNEKVWSPLFRGSELDWSFFTESAAPIGIATSAMRMILNDPTWDYRTVDFDRHVAAADRSDIARVSASNPDISGYLRRGGKLILSGGWNNALVPAGAVLDYYKSVEAQIGITDTRAGVRLYMVPGMIECNGGPGHRHLRHAQRDAALGRERRGTERRARLARRARQGRAHAAAVPLSAGRDVPRQREHRTKPRTSFASRNHEGHEGHEGFWGSVLRDLRVLRGSDHAANGFSSAVGP